MRGCGFSRAGTHPGTWALGWRLFTPSTLRYLSSFLKIAAIRLLSSPIWREAHARHQYLTYVLRKHPPLMLERFRDLDRDQLWLSAIVAAELRFGAEKQGSSRFLAAVEAWLSGFQLRDWPFAATHHYARLRAHLEVRGTTPVGNLDLMIAAHALAEDSVVITNNARKFHRIPGVAVEEWRLD